MTTPFGKWKGARIEDLPDDYLYWLTEIELDEPLRSAINREWLRRNQTSATAPANTTTIRLKPEDLPLARKVFDAGYRTMARKLHPDAGGDAAQMQGLNLLAENVRTQLEAAEARPDS